MRHALALILLAALPARAGTIIPPSQALGYLLFSQPSVQAGDTVSNTGVETNFATTFTIPANTLVVNDVLDIRFAGVYSDVAAPGMNLRMKYNTTNLLSTGNATVGVGVTNAGWCYDAAVIVRSLGAAGTLEVQGRRFFNGIAGDDSLTVPNAAAVTVDTTVDATINCSADWSVGAVGNSITQRLFTAVIYRR